MLSHVDGAKKRLYQSKELRVELISQPAKAVSIDVLDYSSCFGNTRVERSRPQQTTSRHTKGGACKLRTVDFPFLPGKNWCAAKYTSCINRLNNRSAIV